MKTLLSSLCQILIKEQLALFWLRSWLFWQKGHDKIVKKILKRLEENDLYIKPEKYIWKARKIRFLGVIIGPNRIEMEAKKIEGVLSWLESKNVKDVRKFLGFANYYRRFIKDFAQVVRPINMLMRKDKKWWWRKEQ